MALHKHKIRQTHKKKSTYKEEDFVQRSTKSGRKSSRKSTNKKRGGKTKFNVIWKPTTVLKATLEKNLTGK